MARCFRLVSKLETPCTWCSLHTNHSGSKHSKTVTSSTVRNLRFFSSLNSHSSDHHWLLVLFSASKEHGVKCGIAHETNVSSDLGLASFNGVIQDRFSNISNSVFPPLIECNNAFIGLLWNLGLMYQPSRLVIGGRVNTYCYNLLLFYDHLHSFIEMKLFSMYINTFTRKRSSGNSWQPWH